MSKPKEDKVFLFIEGKSASLCPLNMEHINLYTKWMNDPQIRKYERNKFPQTVEDVKKSFEPKNQDVKEELFFEIMHNNDKKPIGYIGFPHIHWFTRNANIFYLVGDTNYWGQNIATEAVKLTVNYGFSELNLHKITARIFSPNLASRKVVEKIGFKHEITLKKEVYFDGEYVDILEYSIFKEDWMGSI
ncbi:MAG: GNAT family N-acetyltransferase [Candidatus Odinarchaeota archaeon]